MTATNGTALLTKDLTKRFKGPQGDVRALTALSLEVAAGEFVAVRGPSGCGKTTLLLMAGGLLVPDEGQVVVDGGDLYAMNRGRRAAYRAEKIGFVFQQFHLVPYLSVIDNVLTPAIERPASDARERALGMISHFGLDHRKHHVPAQLSTGEKQRAALARALLNQPRLVLADEPTGNLDDANADAVLRHLKEFTDGGGAVLLVTHESRALEVANRSIRLQDGRLVEE